MAEYSTVQHSQLQRCWSLLMVASVSVLFCGAVVT